MNTRAAVAALTVVLLLTGCDPASDPVMPEPVSNDPNGKVVTFEVNGRTVSCVVIDPAGDALAMSCDWTRVAG